MTNENITSLIHVPPMDYIMKNWVWPRNTNFIKKHILSRVGIALTAPVTVITGAIDTLIALGAGVVAILSLGKYEPILHVVKDHFSSTETLLSIPYSLFLLAMNPGAKFNNVPDTGLTAHLLVPLANKALTLRDSDYFFNRHITFRLSCALLVVARLITGAVDGLMGIPLMAISVCTLGRYVSINDLTYNQLTATGIIQDLFQLTLFIVNPWNDY